MCAPEDVPTEAPSTTLDSISIPRLACRLAFGEHVEPVTDYAVGLRYRWFIPYSLLSLVSAGAAGAGFLWSLFDPQKRCWHDCLSGTRLYRC